MDYSIKIGGEAGQGIQTIGDALTKVFSRLGFHVFSHQDYESRVRGGHNFFQIRLCDRPVSASREKIDILIAFDKESILLHREEMSEQGIILYDSKSLKETHGEPEFLDIPFEELAETAGGKKVMANSVATGAVLGMLGVDLEIFMSSLKDALKRKDEATLEGNRKAAQAGRDMAVDRCLRCSFSIAAPSKPRMLIDVNQAIGLGAIASGCKFYSAYPMTPSTGVMIFMAGKAKEYGIIVEQAEDEIAAINMALGASFAGVRAMTGTSGGGFALMTEGLSLAAMTETPVVIVLAQRPGPATGLPTRTEQGDLLFALHAGHGEFPRIIFAPGSPEQAFYLTNKAFDLSQKYQVPAIIMTDQYLADALWTFDGLDVGKLVYRDHRLRADRLADTGEYTRHALTENGVSPFAVPFETRHLVVTDSDEHSEAGHIIEDARTRVKMVQKRLFRKAPPLKKEIGAPCFYGEDGAEVLMVGWGSTYGLLKEVVDELSPSKKIAMLHFSEVYPLPEREPLDYVGLLEKAATTICVEQNATGQFSWLLRAETGFEFDIKINRFDGRPFMLEDLTRKIHAHIG